MHLMTIEYDVYGMESEDMSYDDPKNSKMYVTVLNKSREECMEALRDKVISIFGSYSESNITSYIVDAKVKSKDFSVAYCSKGHCYD